ncbi:MAG: GDP/UDP-N,N'-diacetylbacillosamine 2-epimerase (hydrolyzing) [Congregibacter sp.]|jgi:GDP/UDP-N,N'-diacetylbacillosamine 2-epimerase (hydrolysing)
MQNRICVVTGSRADYGLLYWLLRCIQDSPHLDLQIIVTGMHLSPEYGYTLRDIESDGFRVDWKVDMLLSSGTAIGVTKSMGLGLIGFADALAHLQPDILLVLGDRYEIYAASAAAMIARIPIAHLHGGETTEGAFDEAIRHSITKMSHLHFVATEEYRRRVVQLGEEPERVFCVGGLGIDNINHLKLLSRSELEVALDFKLGMRNLLITFHPVTLEHGTSELQMNELLAALSEMDNTHMVFTMPNSDPEGRLLFKQIEEFCEHRFQVQVYTSLGQLRYLSCIEHFDGVIGNSSSGLLEVPSFKKGTINIGDRQRGRICAESVINCKPDRVSIRSALKRLYTKEFEAQLSNVENPYGDGGASEAIVKVLEQRSLDDLLKKRFYDYPEQ